MSFAVQDPERSLDNAAESAIRHEVGSNFMDQILTTGREQMAAAVQDRLQEYMDNLRHRYPRGSRKRGAGPAT